MQDPDDLERVIDQELRRLPVPRAPRTLLPRVLAAAAVHGVPQQARPGVTAVDGWRVGAAVALALLVVVAVSVVFLRSGLTAGPIADALHVAAATTVLMRVVWDALLQPVFTYAVMLVLLLAFASSAIWAAFRYVAFEGVSQP